MKFTHSLAFNAVPEWKDGYINYKKLTSLAYDAERHAAAAAAASAEGDERSARLSLAAAADAESAFKRTLESERHKCLDFFAEKEAELIASTRLLEERLAALESMTDTPPAHLLNSSFSAPPPLTTAAATAATAAQQQPPRSPRSPGGNNAGADGSNNSGSSGSINAAEGGGGDQQQQPQEPQSPIAALRQQRPAAAFDPLRSPLLARRSINAAEQGVGGAGAALAQTSSLFLHTSPTGPGLGGEGSGAYSTSAMALTRRARALLRLRLRSGEAKAEVSDLRLEAEELFVALAGLVSFVDINKTGFRKALKKHDKVAVVDGVPGLEVRPLAGTETAETISRAFDERCRTSALEEAMEAVVLSYAVLATGGELGASAAELRGRLRDRLVIERGTVWQEMVTRERRTAAARVVGGGGERSTSGGIGLGGISSMGIGGGGGGAGNYRRASLDFGRSETGGAGAGGLAGGGSGHGGQAARKLLLGPAAASAAGTGASASTSRAGLTCFGSTTALAIAAAVSVFFALLASPLFPHAPEKRNCLALLAFVSALWTTEAIPLYATSMLVPALVIGLRVMVSPLPDPETGHRRRLLPKEAAPLVFSAMMSQVIMLLLGGFAMAAALSKHYVAKWAASAVLGRLGRSPASLLLASMGVAAFLSMWISNVAAPVLVYSLLAPVLRTLPPRGSSKSGDHMSRALALGVALASNLGGMTSPISSPQNVFAIERMAHAAAVEGSGSGPGWLEWFAVALPVAGCGVVACWGALLLAYPAARSASVRSLARQAGGPAQRFTGVQVYVVAVCAATVALWCANASLEHELGGMGVTATLPLVAFFGTGVLTKDDFNSMLWTVVMLAQGGLALGAAVDSCGLLHSVASAAASAAATAGLSPWGTLAALCALVLVATTFVSHTVGAMVILPIVESIGTAMLPRSHAQLLVMGAALTCSGAMGLPVSGFPNMAAASLEAADGEAYLSPADFVRVGVPCSVVAYLLIITLGYRLMTSVNGW